MAEPTFELFHSGVWNDVTADVRVADGFTVTHPGAGGRSGVVAPSRCGLTFDSPTGVYNNRNPNSPLYGLVGRNTPLRVSTVIDGDTEFLFSGEVSQWPQRWNVAGTDVRVPVEAAGVLSRLNQGAKPLRSALHRAVMSSDPLAYWPMDDGHDVTLSRSPVPGVPPLVVGPPVGLAEPGAFMRFDATRGMGGTGDLVDFTGGGQLTASVPRRVSTSLRMELVLAFTPGTYDAVVSMLLASFHFVDGTVFRLNHDGLDLYLEYTDPPSFSFTELTFTGRNLYDGRAHHVRVDAEQDGTEIDVTITVDGVFTAFDVWTGRTLSTLRYVVLNEGNGAGAERPSMGHVAVWAPWAGSVDTATAATGHTGETAGRRIERLCAEEGVAFVGTGDLDATGLAGPQRVDTLVNLLRHAVSADQGVLFELRSVLGLGYRTLASLYNQTPVELDYAGGHVAPPMHPTDDDQALRNDVTVNRPDGGGYRATKDTGPLSTQPPPDGVGTYDRGPVDAHVAADAQLPHVAGWVLHLGTWDEARYPGVAVNLAAPVWAAQQALAAAVLRLDTGDLLRIDNPPAWLPPGPVVVMVDGYTVVWGDVDPTVTFDATPGGPYTVGVLDDDVLGRLDTAGSELAGAVGTGDTTLDVATTEGPLWTTDDAETPFDVMVGGELMTVTDVGAAGAGGATTFGAAGTPDHGSNTSVTPGIPAGVATGDLLLVLAAIRNSGTGVPDTPTGAGYVRWPVFGAGDNVQLFAKVATSGAETAPTVTMTGGVAGATVSGQMIRVAGSFPDAAGALVASDAQLSSSAQDVAHPALVVTEDGCLVLVVGWKQDDWTSVATLAGMTEVGEPDSTSGDDHGIVWDWVEQGAAANIGAGSFVVTGGGAAISRGATLAVGGGGGTGQAFTVTRSVNGVVKSHPAGAPLRLADPLTLAL